MQYVELDTNMETFAYWLERDWPRVKEFEWLTLRQNYAAKTDARFERRWEVYPRTKIPNFFKLPILEIFAESVVPGKVIVVWTLTPPGHKFLNMPSPIESMADWVWFRFEERAKATGADGDDNAVNKRATVGDEPISVNRGGRPKNEWNKRAIDRLLAGENPKDVRAQWRIDYEAGTSTHPCSTEDGEKKTWEQRVWNPYREISGRKG